jgi:hypothetical protein
MLLLTIQLSRRCALMAATAHDARPAADEDIAHHGAGTTWAAPAP